MTAPPFAYYGGKTRIADRIVELLPPHEHYVEPFAGSLAVLLAKPAARMETVNDLDGDLMLFWRLLRDRADELIRVCALTPHSRAEFAEAGDRPESLPDLERARRTWVRLSQGRASGLLKTGWRHYVNPSGSSASMPGYLEAYVDRMAACAARIKSVTLEQRPALELIERYGSEPDVCLYVDPPYLGEIRNSYGYRHEMRDLEAHRALAEALNAARAAVVLSGYASPLYSELYAGWHVTTVDTTTGQGGARAERTEVLWSNRAPAPTLFDAFDQSGSGACLSAQGVPQAGRGDGHA